MDLHFEYSILFKTSQKAATRGRKNTKNGNKNDLVSCNETKSSISCGRQWVEEETDLQFHK